MNINNIKNWVRVFRLPFHLALIIPFLLGAELAAWHGYSIDLTLLVVSTFAVFLMTSACFISNEYFDYRTDLINKMYNQFTGGSRVLPEGILKREELSKVIWACIFLAGFLGLIVQFYFKAGDLAFLLGAFGMFVAYAYTAKPFRFAYRGLGEISIGIGVGWLPIFSGYYLQAHEISMLPTLIALPYIIATILLIHANEFPDYESDKASGKRNIVVRLGREKAVYLHTALIILMWLCFLPLIYIKPGDANILIGIPVFMSLLNIMAMHVGAWKDRSKMEFVCKRTIIYTILVPAVTGVIFFL